MASRTAELHPKPAERSGDAQRLALAINCVARPPQGPFAQKSADWKLRRRDIEFACGEVGNDAPRLRMEADMIQQHGYRAA